MVQNTPEQLLNSRTTGGENSVILPKGVNFMVPSPTVGKQWLLEGEHPKLRKFPQLIDSNINNLRKDVFDT